MKQCKKHSALESITNVVLGLVISFVIQLILYPILNIKVSLNQNLIITFVFFITSFVRGYFIRRFFNLYQNEKKEFGTPKHPNPPKPPKQPKKNK